VRVSDAEPLPALEGRSDEAVHASAVDVLSSGLKRMRATRVDQVNVVEGIDTVSEARIREAGGRSRSLPRDAVRAWEGPEVVVERAVLLHDDDHVLDRVDAASDLKRWDRCGHHGGSRDRVHEDGGRDHGTRRPHDRATDPPGHHRTGCAVGRDPVQGGTETSWR
jgi:hypothetical protein